MRSPIPPIKVSSLPEQRRRVCLNTSNGVAASHDKVKRLMVIP